MRRLRWTLLVGALAGAIVGAVVLVTSDDEPPTTTVAPPDGGNDRTPVDLLAGEQVDAEVGDRLALRVEENPSVGDRWVVAQAPDDAVARIVDRFSEGVDTDLVGAGHTEVFVLEATGPGTTSLTLHNCFRCDVEGNTPPENEQFAIDLDYDIRVR